LPSAPLRSTASHPTQPQQCREQAAALDRVSERADAGRVTGCDGPLEGSEDTVVLAMEDNGRGVSRDVEDRLFQPFVTTRTDRPSAGLGLAVSVAIAFS
jgi:C4-dicarboxylate-specific signal transduction histidine kinase